MLTLEQIKEMAEMVARLELGGVEIERSGFRVKIKGKPPAPVAAAPPPAPPQAAPAAAPSTPAASTPASGDGSGADPATGASTPPDESEQQGSIERVESPLVGTFYRRPAPGAEPFVTLGSEVTRGQVLCIVESMKLMNEVESDTAGTIVDILVEDGEPVEYGQPLFKIRVE